MNRLTPIIIRCTPITINLGDVYCIRPDKGYVWLQRLCCYVMHKLGAFARAGSVDYQQIHFDGAEFIARLLKQKSNLLTQYNMKPTRLLIGARDFSEMMCLPDIRHMVSFDTNMVQSYYERNMVCSMRVTVIPWMTGVLVLPDNCNI